MSGLGGIGRHVLILTPTGSFTAEGAWLSNPVDDAEKLGKLIMWAFKRGGLQPLPGQGEHHHAARVWVVGGAVALLVGSNNEPEASLGRAMAPLVDEGWELRRESDSSVVLARGHGEARVVVEVVAEHQPWLAAGDESVADDAAELGRRLDRWYAALGVLPGPGGALSGAALADHVTVRRDVGVSAGLLPQWVSPEVRVQPPWCPGAEAVAAQFERCDDLMCLTQLRPSLASAGMLTFGYGRSQSLEGDAAVGAALGEKLPFGLWLVDLPAAQDLDLPQMLPFPHPAMAGDHRVQAWVSTEDLVGLAKDVRDGGAGLTIAQLGVSEAIVWPAKVRILEGWATRMRAALDDFADDEVLQALVEVAAADYLQALADPEQWGTEALQHHYQPAWAAAIASHVRFRGRRAAVRISREYRAWPVYIDGVSTVYSPPRSDDGGAVDLTDTHTRLGRLVETARTELTNETVLAVLLAESTDDVVDALAAALELSRESRDPLVLHIEQSPGDEQGAGFDSDRRAGDDEEDGPSQDSAHGTAAGDHSERPPARRPPRSKTKGVSLGGVPAAVLHVDGLWMPDGTKYEVPEPIKHVGDVAELAYTHNLGYQLTTKFAEPGQIWITVAACAEFGIDVERVREAKPGRRDEVLREVTEGIPFVGAAVLAGWTAGGKKDTDAVARLGTWTRVYRPDQERKGVWVALMAGMPGAGDAEKELVHMPLLADAPEPPRIARRLKLLADGLGFPWKIGAGPTAIDLMVAARPKGTTIDEWRNGPLAPSTFEVPFTVNDVERDFNWTRPPSAEEAKCLYLHAYDRGASYPAAIAGLELPIGDPIHYPDGEQFADPAMLDKLLAAPGLVTVVVPEQQDWRVPYLLNPGGLQFTGPKPVTTARLAQAVKFGYVPTIVEAYSWPHHGRVLNGWYQRIRDAATMLDTDDPDAQIARQQSKVIRNVGIGLMGSDQYLKGKLGYDPMKRLSIIGKASANIAYRIDEIGQATDRWPVAAQTDMILYVSDNPDPQVAWPGAPKTWGRGFGQYKHAGSALLADHLQFLTGGSYTGVAALTEPEQWAEQIASLTADANGAR